MAMGTLMAVNFANVFMGRSERRMLQDYERIYDRKPTAWLRYIDDILFLWHGMEKIQHKVYDSLLQNKCNIFRH